MPLTIDISDHELKYLSAQAGDALNASTKKYTEDLLKEAHRLEAARSSHTGQPEVTASMVNDASVLLRTQGVGRRKSWPLTVIQVSSSATTLVVGCLFDLQSLQGDTRLLVVFIVALCLAVALNVVQILMGRAA